MRGIEADSPSSPPFVVTEYAPGPSLSEYIDKHGSVGPEMLFGLATGLAEALTTIHAAGIMHRDLKPSNIILTDAGVITFPDGHRYAVAVFTRAHRAFDGELASYQLIGTIAATAIDAHLLR